MKANKAALMGAFLFMVLTARGATAAEIADTIYYGGPIVTMIRDGDRVEALAVADGKILATGSEADVMALKGTQSKLVDLNGNCLMPGFIDPHSHVVMQSAKFACVNLDPYPIGDVRTIADIQKKLRERIAERKPEAGRWIIGWGYDDTGLQESRHPNRDDLDAVSTEHPILLMHISSHLMACNSKALELAGITADTPDPEGGVYQRKADRREPNGVLEETAMLSILMSVPLPTAAEAAELLEEGLEKYAAEGITTVQDGASFPNTIKLLRSMNEAGKLPVDVVAYPLYKACDDALIEEVARTWKQMGRFRLGGVKVVTDGSIQGYTAYLSKPYFKVPQNAEVEEDACANRVGLRLILGEAAQEAAPEEHADESKPVNRGYPGMSQEDIDKWVRTADEKGFPILVHCNGDASIDMLIEAVKKSRGDWPRPDLRTTIIHCQTIRDDQLNFAASNGLVPSYFPIHVVFWGDRHRDLFLGPERAERINPARSALDRGMKLTLHHDAPIAHWGMLPVVDAAVNRVTSSGKLLGPEERITPFEALCGVTRDAAWQYFEEHRKGTLEPGKLADLVILDNDPLAVDPMTIKNIRVLETVKEGKTVYGLIE